MTLDNYYTKWRRMFTAFAVINFAFSIFQLFFAYQHIVKHEWWMMLVSIFFFAVNFGVGIHMTKQVKHVNLKAKQHVWTILRENGNF